MKNNPLAIVTGASRGIGKAVAINFAEKGYDVALVAQNETLLQELHEHIQQNYSVNSGVFVTDVSVKQQVDETFQKILQAHGRVDVLFNNAGILRKGTSDLTAEDLQQLLDVNVVGAVNCIQAVTPLMKQQQSGYIMNLASRSGKTALSSLGGYALTKFALVGFNEALFKELAPFNVKVTAICPSVIDTDMTASWQDFPNEEKIQLSDIVHTVNYLLSLGDTALIKDIDVYCRHVLTRAPVV